MRQIYYDLTELLYLSKGYKSFYGIAKVVAEGAKEAFRSDMGVRFVVFSQAHDAFFEVFPQYDDSAEGGVDLNVPNSGKPWFTRRMYNGKKRFLHRIAPYLFGTIDRVQRAAWAKSNVDNPIISLDGGDWLSCGRPKLIIHPMQHLASRDVRMHVLMHDVIPMHDIDNIGKLDFPTSYLGDVQWLVRHADHIIGNSQFTIDDMQDFVDIDVLPPMKRTSVAALVHELRSGDDPSVAQMPNEPFFLMVGTMLGRKNLDVVLDTLNLFVARGETPPLLVLAGKPRHRTQEKLDTPEMAKIKDRVLQIDSPNQSDLIRLYEASEGVILPSRIEGWGLPAAEALWAGVPAICSDIPVMREVCGDLGLFFGVDDPDALEKHLRRLLEDKAFAKAHRIRIKNAHDTLRTWRHFGQDLLANTRAAAS